MIDGKESFAYVIQRLCQKFSREIFQSAHGSYLCKVLAFVLQPSKSCVLKMRIHKPCVTILLFFEWLTALLLLNCHQFTDGSGQFNAIFDGFSTILSGIRQVYSHTAVELHNSFDLPMLLCTSLERASFGKNNYSAQNLFLTLTLHLSYTFFHNVIILSTLMPYNTVQL